MSDENEQIKLHHHTHEIRQSRRVADRVDRIDFMHHAWKPLAATVYLLICIFDFIVAPLWTDYTEESYGLMLKAIHGLDPVVQQQIIMTERRHWQPLTLIGGGIFHFSFGAILTGVAVVGHRGLKNNSVLPYAPQTVTEDTYTASRGPSSTGPSGTPGR